MKMMIFAMILLIVCHAALEYATSSRDADRVTSVCSIWNKNRVINAKNLVLHEEDMSQSVKCDNMEKG